MADTKISDLNALGTAASDDVLAIVDSNVDETKKITFSDLIASGASASDQVLIAVKNSTGSTLDKGKLVYITGATGGTPTVALCDNTDAAKDEALGIVTDDIVNNADGNVAIQGLVTSLDTSGFSDGDTQYMSTSGNMVATVPTTGAVHHIGTVAFANASTGKIVVSHHNEPYIAAPASTNIDLRMGDNAGANKISFEDYDDVEVAAIDSNGNFTLDGTVDGIDIATDVTANTAKNTNVTTNLSLGAVTATTMVVASSDGTDATLIEADTTDAGLLGSAKWDEIVANTLKDTNVTTNLSMGTVDGTQFNINSSDGTNVSLPIADTNNWGLISDEIFDEIVVNTAHAADNTQAHSDYLLNSGADIAVGPITITADNSSADQAYVPMVLYNTDDTPPAASGFPVGTLYVQYTA